MSIFDPLGLISPFSLYGKMILQNVWISGVDWDCPLEEKEAEQLQIPRCYASNWSSDAKLELHVFEAASEGAYAAVAYIRSEHQGKREINLTCSETRVAPNKPISIPRLELLAAVLGARLTKTIMKGHSIQFKEAFIWSDSRTVLSWLRSDARKYHENTNTFVGLRISEILRLTELSQWRWVPTKQNVADDAIKWVGTPRFYSESR